jgi:hypothetical protein
MRKHLFILTFLISVISYGQNWNVFNKGYRYNYKFDNSALISNVLFADSVKQTGIDTTYFMNRVGVVVGNTLHINQPQFLMKKIFKMANGEVQFQDTTTMSIIPSCSVSQSWTFGTSASLTATCVAISTVSIFNAIDSVKIIILSNNDSILLSKEFGMIQFPKLYTNFNYRLVGIENRASYDSISLSGEKVLNAWDIYKFNSGDKYRTRYTWDNVGTPWYSGCSTYTVEIISRSITSNGYSYLLNGQNRSASGSSQFHKSFCDAASTSTYAPINPFSAQSYTNLNSGSLWANKMYPGMVVGEGTYNIVFFGVDNLGTFYKYFGPPSCSSTLTSFPGAGAPGGFALQTWSSTALTSPSFDHMSLYYGEGLGMVSQRNHVFEHDDYYCKTSAVKNGVEYFSPWTIPPNDIGIKENSESYNLFLFPNPANSQIQLPIYYGQIKLYDCFGKLIMTERVEGKNYLDIYNLPNGLYFIEIQTDSFKSSQKLIIQH